MATAIEIVFGAGLGLVGLSFAALVLERASERLLLWLCGLLGVAALLAAVSLGVDLLEDFAETDVLALAAGGLAAATAAEAGLVALRRGLRRVRDLERLGNETVAQLAAFLEQETQERTAELERTLARERAEAGHLLTEQERRLTEERRAGVERQIEEARAHLADAVARVQQRLERRLASWAADLDRGQRELEAQLGRLAQRQREALATYDARLTADAERVAAAAEEQRVALARLRAELERLATQFTEEGRAELETHTAERRRALHEVGERLRGRERALREQIDREETEARARLSAGFEEIARRQRERLERALDLAATRLAEEADRRFDQQIKQSREKSAERLSRELDRALDQFARRAEKEVADRITEAAQKTAARLQRRVEDMARAAEAQQQVSAERVRLISERLDQALEAAEERIAGFESQIEIEVSTKLAELERTIRAAEAP